MGTVPFTDHAGLSASERETLLARPCRLRGLDEIFAWGRTQNPPVHPADVIKQDEFTHDVLVPFSPARWLVYGTT
jgi:hypothetical protein